MLARIFTSAINGITAVPVEVEVRVRDGQRNFSIIGMGDVAIREAKDRVISALRSSGFHIPQQILVNLAPAELKKEGASFDLAIALGILIASEQIELPGSEQFSVYGELSLDGVIKPVRGVIAYAIEALKRGAKEIIVPVANIKEASLISEVQTSGLESLRHLVSYLTGESEAVTADHTAIEAPTQSQLSLSDVRGQKIAKRALTIAAAGGLNVLMVGPPGCGKSLLARRFPLLLAPLRREEMLEVVRIHSIAAQPIDTALRGERPFRAPHHSISEAGLIGGGTVPRPGEISLCHRGVLFLDEFPEFRRGVLEALRAPLEQGWVSVSRARGSSRFPARFQLIAAMNPCPCGRLGVRGTICRCSRSDIQSYMKKLSQPILDRIDIHVDVEAVPFEEMTGQPSDSEKEREQDTHSRDLVSAARDRAFSERGEENGQLDHRHLEKHMHMNGKAASLFRSGAERLGLSARGCVRTMRVARTIADIADSGQVGEGHVAEALGYRGLERLEGMVNR